MGSKRKVLALAACGLLLLGLAGCDVEKQMDTMVDNPSFAEPLFTKFLAKPEYQAKAMDLILGDPAMRQTLLEKVMTNPEWARAAANQLMSSTEMRDMVGQMLTNPPTEAVTPPATP